MLRNAFDELLTDAQLRAAEVPVRDDFVDGQVLAEQTGAGAVLVFTFSSDVNLAVVEASGADTDVARVQPFESGANPTSSLGFPARHQVPSYFPVTTAEIRVFTPAGMAVNVIGYKRP